MLKNIDNEGRIVIPKEMKKELHIKNNDTVRIEIVGKMIIITNKQNDNITIQQKICTLKSINCEPNNVDTECN